MILLVGVGAWISCDPPSLMHYAKCLFKGILNLLAKMDYQKTQIKNDPYLRAG
jgi:hypothetical protein